MTYVMSDLHGDYEKYASMLEKISFSSDDVLFIMGDVIDRGPEPVRILRDMAERENVFPLMGNHEYMALMAFDELSKSGEEDEVEDMDRRTKLVLANWLRNGGGVTLDGITNLPSEECAYIIEYMRGFSPIETVEVGGKRFVLVHAGFAEPPNTEVKKLCDYDVEDLVFERPDYNERFFDDEDTYLIMGHTPTLAVTGKAEIYKSENNFLIDCGAVYGGRLACLRLDDLEEFYV